MLKYLVKFLQIKIKLDAYIFVLLFKIPTKYIRFGRVVFIILLWFINAFNRPDKYYYDGHDKIDKKKFFSGNCNMRNHL